MLNANKKYVDKDVFILAIYLTNDCLKQIS